MKKLLIILSLLTIVPVCSPKREASSNNSSAGQTFKVPNIPFQPKRYICYRTEAPPVIDGKMTESGWHKADWTDDFMDIQGPDMPAPRFRTRAKMLWDDGYFYVFAQLQEPDVWATLKRRDSIIYHDNDFEVFIDPNGDTHRYYELEVNAFSTEWDLFLDKPYRDGGRPLVFWDIRGLKTSVSVNGTINHPGDRDRGWSLEIAIPWNVLKECADKPSPPENGDQWRINFSRVEWRTRVAKGAYVKVIDPRTGKPLPEDNWVWSPQGLVNMHYPEMWGFVQFSDKIVGSGFDQFVEHAEEKAKWALRQVYYGERNIFLRQGRYSDHLSQLGLTEEAVPGYRWPPKIERTWNLFEAILPDADGNEVWHIREDGLVWKSE